MLTSLAIIILFGILFGKVFESLGLPRIIGMLLSGIIIGPFGLNFLDGSILTISAELRKLALIIILIKAGLTLDLLDLKKVGRPAILLSFLPALFEIIAYTFFAPLILGITRLEAALMGSVLGAVSPAVVVPRMVDYIENGYGTKKGIPQMILAGASCDDIFVIVLFTSFMGMNLGENLSVSQFLNVPFSIILGIILGILFGFILMSIFKKIKISNTIRIILILGFSLFLIASEIWLEDTIPVSGLLAVVSMAATIKFKLDKDSTTNISKAYGEIWKFAEILLFVLVGAAVDIRFTLNAGYLAVIMIFIALAIRTIGVFFSLLKTSLNSKEKIFCVISYIPKATVQAAIGSIPLSSGLETGNIILSVAVLSIIITAPIGAFLMDANYQKILVKE